ncbi:MAG: hypothetical protein HXY47_06945 [Nitrospirae bacterium]|nr:hypothetical protein [Nitrospirota bacterium]
MNEVSRYEAITRHITSIEVYFDVLHVLSNHGLLSEVKKSSIDHIFTQMEEDLSAIKKLNEEAYGGVKQESESSSYVSPF